MSNGKEGERKKDVERRLFLIDGWDVGIIKLERWRLDQH